jgi:ABC-type sugar transport system ATPase subunit
MPALLIQRLTKRFPRGIIALDDLTLEVPEGELMTIVGPSGSGKTTLLRSIAGLEPPDAGNFRLGEILLDSLPPRRREVAMLFQQPALYPHLSVRDNVAFPLRMRGESRATIARQVGEISARLGIEQLLDCKPHQLSGGQAQRVSLARALVRKPRCLLLDEPLSNLDAPLRIELRAQLKSIHAEFPIITLHVTHDQDEALALGDRVAVLDAGRLQQIAAPDEIVRQPANDFVAKFFRHLRR